MAIKRVEKNQANQDEMQVAAPVVVNGVESDASPFQISQDFQHAPKRRGPKPGVPRGPRGPQVQWNDARYDALVDVMGEIFNGNGGLTLASITRGLQSHPLFAGSSDVELLTPAAVQSVILRLRKQEIPLPELDRGRATSIPVASLTDKAKSLFGERSAT